MRARALEAAVLLALAAALFGPRLDHPFVTDDAIYIVENRAVTEGVALGRYFSDRATVASNPDFQWQSYRPLRTLAFRAVVRVAGLRPLAFGLVNLGLYVAAALLLLGLGRRLGAPGLWGAVLWVAAPVHVEPVLYASSLGDQLSLVLELGGLTLAFDSWRGGRLRAVLGVVLVAAALLAKEMAVTAPVLLALLAWGAGVPRRRAAPAVAALVGAAVLFLVARTAVLGAVGHGAVTAGGTLGQLAMVPWRLGAYLKLAVAPLGHGAAYVLPRPPWAWLALSWLALVAVALLLRRWGSRAQGAALLWFAVALAPVLGLVPLFADLADRFALLPTVGLAWLVAPALVALRSRSRLLALVAPALLLVGFAAGTMLEGRAWRDEASLWSQAVAVEPRSAQAQRNLGLILLQRGAPAEALLHFDEARALGEQAGELDRRRAMALEALGRREEAEEAAREAVRRDPELGAAHALYGGLLVSRGALVEAEGELVLARRWEPERPSTLLLEVALAAARGEAARELAAEEALIARFPAEPRFRHRHAETLLRLQRWTDAAAEAHECLRLAPGQAQCACTAGRASTGAGRSPTAAELAACAVR
jgi:hypothetical protein